MLAHLALISVMLVEPAESPVCHDSTKRLQTVADERWQEHFDDSLRRAAEYQASGNYRLAMDVLCPLREEARARGPRELMLASAAMGRALSYTVSHHDVAGDPAVYLNESLSIARELDDKSAQAAVLNDLANLHAARGERDAALAKYDESARL